MVRWRFVVAVVFASIVGIDGLLEFPVPVVYQKFSDTLVGNITLGISESLIGPQKCSEACVHLAVTQSASEAPNVACSRAVDTETCGVCIHESIKADNSSSQYYFALDRSPELTGGFRGTPPLYVCLRQSNRTLTGISRSLGDVQFYDPPVLKLEGLLPKRKIFVRVVLNPGWLERFDIPCRNCSTVNRLVVKVPQFKEGVDRCDGFVDQYALPANMAGDENELTEITVDSVRFWLQSSEHVSGQERRQFYRNTFYLCFYESSMARNGKLIGTVEFQVSSADAQAFVAFVILMGIGMPLSCMVTILLHAAKLKRCKRRMRAIRYHSQRQQLDQELLDRQMQLENTVASGAPPPGFPVLDSHTGNPPSGRE